MTRRKSAPLPPDWIESTSFQHNGRTLTPGSEVSIRGERGRFRFLKHVSRPDRGVEWLEFWGGPKHSEQWRNFRPERIRTVHRIATTPEGLLEERRTARKAA